MRIAERSHAGEARPSGLQVLDADSVIFRQRFGRVPFALQHKLTSSGLFTIDRLAATAQKMIATGRSSRLVIFRGGQKPGDKFSEMKRRKPFAAAVSELETSNCWVTFVNISEVVPELNDLYQAALRDVEILLDTPFVKGVNRGHMNVFMASPNVITPYHLDYEHNFLCQIAHEKDVWLWDPDDRDNLSELEIERVYCGDMNVDYAADSQGRAREFHIRPGDALYHPPLAPHWVKNGPEVSISVAIGFSNAALDRRARIYQANRILRKVGLTPPPPGRSAVLDRLRSGAITGMKRWKRLTRVARKTLTRPGTRVS
jgi:hypothetical protein